MQRCCAYWKNVYLCNVFKAQVVKLVDTPLWGGGDECVVQVRLLSWAQYQKLKAHVVKLVNTLHSGCSELKLLEVRVFSWAQAIRLTAGFFCFILWGSHYYIQTLSIKKLMTLSSILFPILNLTTFNCLNIITLTLNGIRYQNCWNCVISLSRIIST